MYSPAEVEMPYHRTRLLETSDGALWVAGQGQEAARLDYGSPAWKTYEGLSYQCETPDGSLWFVSQDSGVVRCNREGRRSGESSGGWNRRSPLQR